MTAYRRMLSDPWTAAPCRRGLGGRRAAVHSPPSDRAGVGTPARYGLRHEPEYGRRPLVLRQQYVTQESNDDVVGRRLVVNDLDIS